MQRTPCSPVRAFHPHPAKHPNTPLIAHAQGATLALTEAAALEVLFANISDGSEVEARLHLFHDILHPRCAVTQLLSNAPWYQNADLKTQVARYYKGPLPDATALNFSEVYREFFYGWDVRMVVGAALREWEGSKEEGAKGEVSKEERVNGEGKE
jgi:salicylate hydroxylase